MTKAPSSSRVTLVIMAIVALTGLVWIAQGLGVPIGGSFMVGDPFWALAGLGLIVVAAALAWRAGRERG